MGPGESETWPLGLYHAACVEVRSVDGNKSGFGIFCIAMDTNPTSRADGRSIADEPHAATYSDLHASTSMGYVFLLEVAMYLSREKAVVENIQ